MKTVSTDYERDCPRCGSDTYVTPMGGTRYCENDRCPWTVMKGGI